MPQASSPPPAYPSSRRQDLHYRSMSQSSSGSNLSSQSQNSASSMPTPTMENLMRIISNAPKGSKVAQDAAKALLTAERERYRNTSTPLADAQASIHSFEMDSHGHGRSSAPSMPPVPPPAPRPESIGASARIGANMLSPPLESVTEADDDPFDLDVPSDVAADAHADDGTDLPYWNVPELPYPPLTPRAASLRAGSRDPLIGGHELLNASQKREQYPLPTQFFPAIMDRVPAAQPAVAIYWRGGFEQQFAFVTDGQGPHGTDDVFPVKVAACHTQIVEVPDTWKGYVRRLSHGTLSPHTQARLAFEPSQELTFFYVSYRSGNDGPVLMVSEPGRQQSGSRFRAIDVAPDSITARDAAGAKVILGTSSASEQDKRAIRAFYETFFSGPQFGAIMPEDEQTAMRVTRDRHIVLDFCA